MKPSFSLFENDVIILKWWIFHLKIKPAKCHFSVHISVQSVFTRANSTLYSVQTLHPETRAPQHEANHSPNLKQHRALFLKFKWHSMTAEPFDFVGCNAFQSLKPCQGLREAAIFITPHKMKVSSRLNCTPAIFLFSDSYLLQGWKCKVFPEVAADENAWCR